MAPFFFAASGLAYPLTIEQLQCKTAIDLEFDISQDPEAMGLGIEVSIDRILVHSTAITFWAKALSLSPRRSRQGAMSSLTGPCQLCMSVSCYTPSCLWRC